MKEMKADMLEVLLYIFTHVLEGDMDILSESDQGNLVVELQAAGFNREQIADAFAWLLSIVNKNAGQDKAELISSGFRVYHNFEQIRLPLESRGLLVSLEQTGLITAAMREEVIERALMLDLPEVRPEHLNWLILSVVYKQSGHLPTQLWLQDFNAKEAGKMH